MCALAYQLERYAQSDAAVIIMGETGSGKERVARRIHQLSSRRRESFSAVNCGAIPAELVEAELFGTTAGAFTGARQRQGWFERAHRGTLLLDEIGEMPMTAQAVLLRVLEDGVFWRVGSERPTQVDVRLLCATHRNLENDVHSGRFRLDLFHRISALIVEIPPLRHRGDDLLELVEQLAPEHAARLTPAAWHKLQHYAWPGNIRELKNVLCRAGLDTFSDAIEAKNIDLRHCLSASLPRSMNANSDSTLSKLKPLNQALSEYVVKAVQRCEGNIRATARALDISPTTVYRYLAMGVENQVHMG
jgi:transcriptional regulator with PAS, ATPase and Fis domain